MSDDDQIHWHVTSVSPSKPPHDGWHGQSIHGHFQVYCRDEGHWVADGPHGWWWHAPSCDEAKERCLEYFKDLDNKAAARQELTNLANAVVDFLSPPLLWGINAWLYMVGRIKKITNNP